MAFVKISKAPIIVNAGRAQTRDIVPHQNTEIINFWKEIENVKQTLMRRLLNIYKPMFVIPNDEKRGQVNLTIWALANCRDANIYPPKFPPTKVEGELW